ncbi:UDP-glucose 4-epimerase GalE [soil metagenome]
MSMAPARILVTGGAGYIGSHVLVELLGAGHDVHVIDSLATGRAAALDGARAIAGRDFGFSRVDLRDGAALGAALAAFRPDAAIHLAGLKAVGASVADPLGHASVNVAGTMGLLRALEQCGCRRLVFSSSAAVYGTPEALPVGEGHPLRPESPYGRSKAMVERILTDLAASDDGWSVAMLRYFNPVGAHRSARIGEDPKGEPSNLVPLLMRAALSGGGVTVHGADWPTRDGSGLRDYLHIADLARGHLAALDWTRASPGAEAFNLGTGRGATVLEMIAALVEASGRRVDYAIGPRRPGDVAASYADPRKAARLLGWRAESGLAEMCASAWAWAKANPGAYAASGHATSGSSATIGASEAAG